MKCCILLLILNSCGSSPFAWQTNKSFKINDSLCISSINILTFKNINVSHHQVIKKPIKNLLKLIANCGYKYKLPLSYKDSNIKLMVPNYLAKYSLGFGDDVFYISINDLVDSMERVIVINYDFNDDYKKFFFQRGEGKGKLPVKMLNGQKIYLYRNWEDRYCGTIFLENNIFIQYCTRQFIFEPELQHAIATISIK
jgi:hypothetical protein